ncbi:bifunctional nicotinamidase/pyrazinamidase [Tunturibacter psychrotolerans]|uniref:Nicotinamidase n=1 Tax=Tunturiibacter psychrotolerans TaxID=3069686 RepID=A0AAU7ZMZ9_9BACT
MPITLGPQDALLVIDVQNDFMPGGALPIKDGDSVVPLINTLAKKFDHVVLTQDWHPPEHISFATTHDQRPYETVKVAYGSQTLWPEHVLQHTEGAAFHPALHIPHAEVILRKGFRRHIDSYSAFLENDHTTPTGLAGYLRERNLSRLFLCGLAYDFCVRYSALDGIAHGFEIIVVEDATRPVDLPGSISGTNAAFAQANIPRIQSTELLGC